MLACLRWLAHLTGLPSLQVTALGTAIVGTSATLFAWHLSSEQETLAAVHPPLMYCLLLALLLLPADFAYKVGLGALCHCCRWCPAGTCAAAAGRGGQHVCDKSGSQPLM